MFRFGTPNSSSALRVMMLGCGELGKEVVISLQRLGCEVIAVDRYAGAPAMQVAHRAHVINMTDGEALRELVIREKPDLVVPEIEAIATDMLVEIERDGLAEVIPTARATQLTMNREGIRRLAAETLGLPTSAYQFADSLEEMQAAIDKIGYPCFIKPVMSSSGKGQSLVRELAGQADVLIENYKLGGLAQYGLDYGSLQALYPRLVNIDWFRCRHCPALRRPLWPTDAYQSAPAPRPPGEPASAA